MSRILLFAGTTEGRELAEALADSKVCCDVSVATEYGVQMMEESEYIKLWHGRLDAMGMRELYSFIGCSVVVDATHPYAVDATKTIKESLEGSNIAYIRVARSAKGSDGVTTYSSAEECATALAKTEGRIFLTTGSKELAPFCKNEELRKRLVVRVLPGLESLKLCYDAGLEGKQIVAAQGPFTKEFNIATIKQFDCRRVVSKESGRAGGEDAKRDAARECGVPYCLIARPLEEEGACSVSETLLKIERILGVALKRKKIDVALIGIGCGNAETTTEEARRAIAQSDYLFGARRMLDAFESDAERYAHYLPEDAIPILERIAKERPRGATASILFSGDSGFYSGCEKMFDALKDREEFTVRIFPGVSSVSMLSARIGIAWHDASIVSLHGVPEEEWRPVLLDSILHERKTIFLASGPEDIRRVGALVKTLPRHEETIRIFVGYSLSYPNERVELLSPDACEKTDEPGLYVGAILQETPKPRRLAISVSDDYFLRGSVPMTKEEVRTLVVGKMGLAENETIYDIGGGTGSIAVQCALASPSLRVYAIECEPEGVELIARNAKRFRVDNVRVVEGLAPDALQGLPPADRAFIGGSKGKMNTILDKLYDLNPRMRVVVTAVSLETVSELYLLLQRYSIANLEILQVAITRTKRLGDYQMFRANNPVFIFSFNFS